MRSKSIHATIFTIVSTATALKLSTSTPQVITGVTPAAITTEVSELGGEAASVLANELEKCYAAASACKSEAIEPTNAVTATTARDETSSDGKATIGNEGEEAAVLALAESLPSILREARCEPNTAIWGISLASSTSERSSLLAAFLRAREWRVDKAEEFLVETLTWRREQSIGVTYGTTRGDVNQTKLHAGRSEEEALWPDDVVRTVTRVGADGQPKTYVHIQLGKISKEMLERVDDFVAWRVRMQEKACEHLGANRIGSHWSAAPRGPTYTLILDTDGIRTFHFGSASRAALAKLTYVFTHYYPDFIGSTVVINAPRFVTMTWSAVSRFMPAWWGVRLGTMEELEAEEGWEA